MERTAEQVMAEMAQPPLPMTPDLWANMIDLMERFEQRTALTELVYGESLDSESKSLRAIEGSK